MTEGDKEGDPAETPATSTTPHDYNTVAETVEGTEATAPPDAPGGTETPGDGEQHPDAAHPPTAKRKRSIYNKEQCSLCGRWLCANTLRFKHDCRKERPQKNKRPHLTSVPLEAPAPAPPEKTPEVTQPEPVEPEPVEELAPPTLQELRAIARHARRERFASKMFG